MRSLQVGSDRDDALGLPLEQSERIGRTVERSISIEKVRALQHDASLSPSEAAWKIYLIISAEQLTIPAANCLLKTLEEPPEHVVLVLTVPDGVDLLPTIVSRSQVMRIGFVSSVEIARALITDFEVEPVRAETLARLAGGRPGWAIRALTDDDVLQERERAIADVTTSSRPGHRDRLAVAERLASGYSRDQASVFQTISLWQTWWWDVHLIQLGCADLVANVDRLDTLESFATQATDVAVVSYLRDLETASRRLVQNVNPRLALEALLVRSPVIR